MFFFKKELQELSNHSLSSSQLALKKKIEGKIESGFITINNSNAWKLLVFKSSCSGLSDQEVESTTEKLLDELTENYKREFKVSLEPIGETE